ncbi:DUF423 domain-containing protein [Roseospira marina]|uniref:DUF423 domain-containing protein n=1 Tax=Roseospira marina TaxID=140057 RepID=A0A5M6ICB1_9PROT|nr:DUF423 domain-containing protein [Roseospira marina]KAA5605762.1 DUF423 domain-containing protein [Roseospira marina]MBB4313566.1 uncharacterized membrane protein YgdD (TMEM256/DUF423 family) [Roseospira marina]MBB5086728.1 uncharacterized membrane protein YgdD (TMEM256/DUF423 family) [Roseospira marina]
MNPARLWIGLGAVLGALAVALGAFAAHALQATGDARAVTLVETAAHYQSTHALALVGCGLLALVAGRGSPAARWASRAAALFLLGVVLFCGALYGIALAGWPLGVVAPFGGTSFIVGWCLLAVAGAKSASGDTVPEKR